MKARLLLDKDQTFLLVYINQNNHRETWWLEAYSRHDGHIELPREYTRTLRPAPLDARAIEFLASYIRNYGEHNLELVSRLGGPDGYTYGGK